LHDPALYGDYTEDAGYIVLFYLCGRVSAGKYEQYLKIYFELPLPSGSGLST
jgi:hypothetical protein